MGCSAQSVPQAKPRAEYEADVQRPGKFQGEQPYIPYLWEEMLGGGSRCEQQPDGSITITLRNDDINLFPELWGRKHVTIYERGDGLVVEV